MSQSQILSSFFPMPPFPDPIVFCDVETTGAKARMGKIIEIGCVRYENGVETDRLVTLLNPGQRVPYTIQMLTGIREEDLYDAPPFKDVHRDILNIFNGATLCAHNAAFDFGFLKAEFARMNINFHPKRLCTAQLSRKLFSQERRHDLSSIIARYNFICENRHRALGDTLVLVQFLKYIQQNIREDTIRSALILKSNVQNFPPQLRKDTLSELPDAPGVYSFFDSEQRLLYVGKSVQIRKRVMSHFNQALQNKRSNAIWKEVADITWEVTASDLGASLLELEKIKNLSPVYNRASRRTRSLWYLSKYSTKSGYIAFKLLKTADLSDTYFEGIYGIFKTKKQATTILDRLAKLYRLCPILLGIEQGKGTTFATRPLMTSRQFFDYDMYKILLKHII